MFLFLVRLARASQLRLSLQMVFIAQMAEKAKDFGYEGVVAQRYRTRRSSGIEILLDAMRRGLKQLVVPSKQLDAHVLLTQMLVEALVFEGRVASSNAVKHIECIEYVECRRSLQIQSSSLDATYVDNVLLVNQALL